MCQEEDSKEKDDLAQRLADTEEQVSHLQANLEEVNNSLAASKVSACSL